MLVSVVVICSVAASDDLLRTVPFADGRASIALASEHSYELVEDGAAIVIRSTEAAEAEVRMTFRELTDPIFSDRAEIDRFVCLQAERQDADCWEVSETREAFFYGNATIAVTDDETFMLVQAMRSARNGVFIYSLQFPERRLADEDYGDRPLEFLTELIENSYRTAP